MPTRRRVLQYGVAAGVGWLPPRALGSPSRLSESLAYGGIGSLWCPLPEEGLALAAGRAFADEPHTRRLVVPPTARGVRQADGADHHDITIRAEEVEVLDGVRTRMLTYDGVWPGPTIRAEVGQPTVVTFRNTLDRPMVIHLHGANTGPRSDGHPSDEIPPGGARVYRYPNRQEATTLWYHDHVMHRTGEHVYRGLAGLYLLHDPAEDALGLPSGVRDLPLLLADRRFDATGQLVYDHNSHGGAFGDVVCVNGVPHPVHPTDPVPLRLRLVNGSNSRIYDLRIDDPAVRMVQVGSDGGLLPAPVERMAIRLSPAERADVVVDLSSAAGRSVHLVDAAALEGVPTLLRFEVAAGPGTPAALPARLKTITALGAPAVTREIRLTRDATGRWQLDGRSFDPARVDQRCRLDVTERWRVVNDTLTAHPFHLHLAQFQAQTRNDAPVPPEERGWKDTVLVPGRGAVELLVRFTQHTGTFVYHCHNLEHEDHDMMAQLRVVALQRLAGSGRLETAAAVAAGTFAPGVPVAVVATAAGFADALTGGPAAARLGGPVLLTAGPTLAEAVRDELRRLAPQRILVLGGPAAVGDGVLEELRPLASAVERLAGPDRFATAAAVSRAVFEPRTPVVYLATGADFPDALAGGAAAAAEGAPVLLVTRESVPDPTRAELARLQPTTVRVLGGPRAVGDGVLAEIAALTGAGVDRLSGPDRFATAVAVSAARWPSGSEAVVVATAGGYPDALAGVPAAAALGAPLLLVTPDGVPPVVADELRRLDPSRIVVLGGTGAVGPGAVAVLDAVLDGRA